MPNFVMSQPNIVKRPAMATSYFPIYKSSSSNTATTTTNGSYMPTTPHTSYSNAFTSKPHIREKTEGSSGYDSDSSDEGGCRPTLPQQGLMLRVTNPDMETEDNKTIHDVDEHSISPTAVDSHAKETHWNQQQPTNVDLQTNKVPVLPPHMNETNLKIRSMYSNPDLPHHESKTPAANMQDLPGNDTTVTYNNEVVE